ncbi:hypothetical protein RchiOBHm_Chr1g0313381 [Rosa chinensis]|uniref:Uncharacterized protein n=1 Tax=Rosa chinensis TaxID=74649 RepID=A0A2P6S6V3_ROSCH|nr:hypothetical protein RchiOBHm_Chr1g0313381 [Rosa chinensis]
MLIHVQFLWNHVDILLASVGISLEQIGEFAFVLLSRASNLHLVEGKLYLLLLGTTALSLVGYNLHSVVCVCTRTALNIF